MLSRSLVAAVFAIWLIRTESSAAKAAPLLQYFAAIQTPETADKKGVPNVTYDVYRPLLTIASVRSVDVDAATNAVTIRLYEREKRQFAALTKRYDGRLLICVCVDGSMSVGKVTAPTTDGVIQFSDARFTGQIAACLRQHFGTSSRR